MERPELEYLCVDGFLRSLVDARALKTAFELQLIDRLLETGPSSAAELESALSVDSMGLRLLLDLLQANGVIAERDGRVGLSESFERALQYRDLMRVKLDFAGFVTSDFVELFTALIADPEGFQRNARLFRLFDYRRGLDASAESYERTRSWVRVTTALTRYEARACMAYHDFAAYRRMLDVGGNSGEFALQLCREHPRLRASVMDLPLVCEIGQEHILPEPERDRIGFVAGNALEDPLPEGFDLVTFKSMLHDWSEKEARRLIAKASLSLDPGGTLLIFERGPIRARSGSPPFSLLPILLFFRSYRASTSYEEQLEACGLVDVRVQEVALETPFFLVTARKPEDPGSTRAIRGD